MTDSCHETSLSMRSTDEVTPASVFGGGLKRAGKVNELAPLFIEPNLL